MSEHKGLYKFNKTSGEIEPFKFANDRKYIAVGVPGAYTPTCTDEHLPGFAKAMADGKLPGWGVVFFAVNDAITMSRWNDDHGSPAIECLADDQAFYSMKNNVAADYGITFGTRTNRCAFIIEYEKVSYVFKDPMIEGVLEEIKSVDSVQ